MLRPERMTKLRIVCSKSHLKDVIEELHNSKVIDIIEHTKAEDIDIGTPFGESSELSELIVKARSLISQLNLDKSKNILPAKLDKKRIREAQTQLNKLQDEVTGLNSRLKDVEARLKSLHDNKKLLKDIEMLGVSLELFTQSPNLVHFIGNIQELKKFRIELKAELGGNYDFSHADDNGRTLICLFVEKNKEIQAMKILQNNNFSEIRLPPEYKGKNINVMKNIEKEIYRLRKEETKIQKQLDLIKAKWSLNLPAIEKALTIIIRKAEAPLMFGETKNIAIISGWVPNSGIEKTINKLNEITKQKISIESHDIEKNDSVPIKLDNPVPLRPYEFFLRLFSLPSYNEFDPSLFMFVTFPLFFGFMLGDIGYGILTLALFIFLKKMIPEGRDLLNIMMVCSVSSIIFGFVFGEAFGFELGHIHAIKEWALNNHIHYPFIHRSAETAIDLIKMSIVIGAFHVNFGLILGFLNVYKNHGFAHALFEKASWFLLEAGVILVVLSATNIIAIDIVAGLSVIAGAALMLFLGEGFQGLVELPSVFVHIGSYMRLMAIGLASVSLAAVINEQSAHLFSSGIFGIIGGILIFTIGHIFNIALGIIGPFLHSLRLHYVEYFTKFYKGGGTEFSPFGAVEE